MPEPSSKPTNVVTATPDHEVTDEPKPRSFMVKGVGGVPDGDWFKLSPEEQEWISIHYPDIYEGILRAIKEKDAPDADTNASAKKKKEEVEQLGKDLDKANAALAAARVANQRVEQHNQLDEVGAQRKAAIQYAEQQTQQLKDATKRGEKL